MISEVALVGWWRVEDGTMHVVLQHEKVRNNGGTAALSGPATFAFHQRGLSLSVCLPLTHIHTLHLK